MAAVTFAVLLGAVSASVRSDLEHLGSCVVTDALVVAQCKALLQGLNSNTKGLREACQTADIRGKRNGMRLNQEELRELVKTKLLNLLPPVKFQALLQYASLETHVELRSFGDVFVAAQEAGRIKELLLVLGPGETSQSRCRAVFRDWGVARRVAGRGTERSVDAAKSELMGVCIRFLKECEHTPDGRAASLSGPPDRGPTSLAEAVALLQCNRAVPLKRAVGKRQALSVAPVELSQLLEGLHSGTVTKKEQVPSMLVAGCKAHRKHAGRVVRPEPEFATREAHRGAVERFRSHLQLDPQCWSACAVVNMRTPQSLDAFVCTLKDPLHRTATPFAKDFRDVHIPSNWDGQHVLRRMAAMELQNASAVARREALPLLDGPLVAEIMALRGDVDGRKPVESFDLLVAALKDAQCSMPDQPAWFQSAWGVKEPEQLHALAQDFDTFLTKHDLRDLWTEASLGTAMVWVGWFGILQHRDQRKAKVEEWVSESRGLFKSPPAQYVLSTRMDTYAFPPFFKTDAESMYGVAGGAELPKGLLPILTAPRVCELCGDGFVNWTDLSAHVDQAHVNWAEYRKRVFWHAQHEEAAPCHGLPMSWARKRRILGNATAQLVSVASQPLGDESVSAAVRTAEPRAPEREPRAMVGCAVCATKEWTERMRRCYMFRTLPVGKEVREEMDEEEAAEAQAGSADEQAGRRRSNLLRDKHGLYYFGPAEEIQQLLGVDKYAERWPKIPVAELHASSVQHPDRPGYRWLLHTRRVPLRKKAESAVARAEASVADAHAEGEAAVAREDGSRDTAVEGHPPCAGIGDSNGTVFLCRWCCHSLCHRKPTLPKRALANDLWGGREHPLYQKLRDLPAARMLLGQARVLYRKVVLNHKHGRDACELQHGLQGNTTFIAQPRTSAVGKSLPPCMEDVGQQLQVIFSVSRTDVARAKPLLVPRSLYLECARLRQQLCPLFHEVEIDVARAQVDLKEDEAPPGIVSAAVRMEEANMFRPNLTGPASSRAADTAARSREDEIVEADLLDEEPEKLDAEAEGEESCAAAQGEAGKAPVEEAENLIGLDEAADNDPLQHYVVLQEQIRRIQEDQARIQRKEEKAEAAQGDAQVVAGMELTAAREACRGHALELREVCRRLADRHEQSIEAELQLLEGPRTPDANVLEVRAGQLLSMFLPESWCLAFTEFFFGDCLPFDQRRPVRIAPRALMACLLKREELEYHLATDAVPYAARPTSRWDNAEVTAMFADTVRRQSLLLATKMTFLSHKSFQLDLQAIAKAKAEDFQALQRYSTLGQAYASAGNRDGPAMKALKHLLTSTAVVPLTEGNKMKLRHFGHAMDMTFGPLKLFLTCNFADTYMPLTMTVFDPSNMERLCETQWDLLAERPLLPALQHMHRVVARSPVTQARVFLLMEEIILTQILGVHSAYIGQHCFDDPDMPSRLRVAKDDHMASNASLGVADFVESLLMPLEAQGRGFAHGHKKVISLPNDSAAKLQTLFAKDGLAMQAAVKQMRQQIVDAVSVVQYDTATLPAQQLGVAVPPEPFSRQQQRHSRLDGGR